MLREWLSERWKDLPYSTEFFQDFPSICKSHLCQLELDVCRLQFTHSRLQSFFLAFVLKSLPEGALIDFEGGTSEDFE